MSVRLTMEAVNKSVTTRMDHLSAHVIRAITCHPIVHSVLVSDCMVLINFLKLCLKYTDINECQTSNGDCEQICTNTVGSFECSCITGFSLSSGGVNCIGKMV